METIDDVPLRSLRLLEAVARHGGFAAAGRELVLSRAVVSRIAATLEAQLGVRLFRRTTRKVALTEAAAQLVAQLRSTVPALHAALAAASESEHAMRGLVRISVSHAFGLRYVVPSLARFLSQQQDGTAPAAADAVAPTVPRSGRRGELAARASVVHRKAARQGAFAAASSAGIQVDLRLEDRTEDLVAQPIDLAVRMGALESGVVIARRVGRLDTVLVAAPALVPLRRELTAGELVLLPAVCFRLPGAVSTDLMPWGLELRGQPVVLQPSRVVVTTDAIEAVVELARLGCGAALVPRYLVEHELARGDLRLLARGGVGAGPPVHLCYLGRQLMPARVRAVLTHLQRDLTEALKRT